MNETINIEDIAKSDVQNLYNPSVFSSQQFDEATKCYNDFLKWGKGVAIIQANVFIGMMSIYYDSRFPKIQISRAVFTSQKILTLLFEAVGMLADQKRRFLVFQPDKMKFEIDAEVFGFVDDGKDRNEMVRYPKYANKFIASPKINRLIGVV